MSDAPNGEITIIAPDGTDPFVGTIHAAYESLDTNGWSDGLPVVLPTPARVEAMLMQTPRDPDELVGVLGDHSMEVTLRTIAVNAVLAGCRAVDFPIVLALAEIMASPDFRVRDASSTTSWEVLPLISGPDLQAHGFNTGPGVTRIGCRANSTIGRFTRLWIRNCVGIRIPPYWTDMAAFGQSTHVALAEDEAGTHELGWPSCRMEWGHARTDTVVGALGVVAVSAPIYTAGSTPDPHLDVLARAIAGSSGYFGGVVYGGQWRAVLALTPATATGVRGSRHDQRRRPKTARRNGHGAGLVTRGRLPGARSRSGRLRRAGPKRSPPCCVCAIRRSSSARSRHS